MKELPQYTEVPQAGKEYVAPSTMNKYLLIVQGDDTFHSETEMTAESIYGAIFESVSILKALSSLTIEDFKSITIAKIP